MKKTTIKTVISFLKNAEKQTEKLKHAGIDIDGFLYEYYQIIWLLLADLLGGKENLLRWWIYQRPLGLEPDEEITNLKDLLNKLDNNNNE
jgi:hypothetical protein